MPLHCDSSIRKSTTTTPTASARPRAGAVSFGCLVIAEGTAALAGLIETIWSSGRMIQVGYGFCFEAGQLEVAGRGRPIFQVTDGPTSKFRPSSS
jgi:hypothetical protein